MTLLGPVYSNQLTTSENLKALVREAGFHTITDENGNIFAEPLDPAGSDFYTVNLKTTPSLLASPDGQAHRMTVAGIHFLANAMRLADQS